MKIVEPIGRGGFGYVYKAEIAGRTVAIKEMYINNDGISSFENRAQETKTIFLKLPS